MTESHVYVHPEIAAVIRLYADLFTGSFRRLSIEDQLDLQAQRMVDAHGAGNHVVATHVTCWHPGRIGQSVREILAGELTLQDARETIAREYGFADWADAASRGSQPPDWTFESAVDALLAGDAERLSDVLADQPSLTHSVSNFGHRATLLHYVGVNGVETHRQVVPLNLAQMVRILLDAGADVNAEAAMYGGGSTTIALLTSGCHPAEAGVMDEVVEVLVGAGARTDG